MTCLGGGARVHQEGMATGFHLSTIAMSVRNYLAIAGPQPRRTILAKLQELWLKELDVDEVEAALKELVDRKLVRANGLEVFEATSKTVYQHRPRPSFNEKERDALAWEWH